MTQSSIGILGTGSYLPKMEVTNEEIASRVDVTPEWIERKTQIRTRRFAAPTQATSDLGAAAGFEALKQSGLSAGQIDYLIVSTSTPDSPQPPTANVIQHKLEAHNAACFDINVVCSGFVYGLTMARALLALKPGAHALVIAADLYSRFLNFDDARTAVLLGDGAGAAVVGQVPGSYGIVDSLLLSCGDERNLIRIDAGGSRTPASHETVDAGAHFFTMHGRGVRDFVLEHVPRALADLLARTRARPSQIDHFVPHQPNGNMLDELDEALTFTNAQTHRTLEEFGNVGSASVPVTLDAANRSGALERGDLVLLAGFGGGMSIGATLVRWLGCA